MHIGIDLGGTKTEIVVLDEHWQEIHRKRVPSAQGCYDATLALLRDLVRDTEALFGAAQTLGIGIPGAISPQTGRIKNANSTWLIGHPFKEDLEALLQRPVVIANDADCLVLSEAKSGAAKGFASAFGVILGTGVGGGWFVNGKLVSGPNAISGEWGHNPLPWTHADEPALPCYCGKSGCIETYLSGPALLQRYNGEASIPATSVNTIVHASQQGEALAQTQMQHYFDQLARALASVINVLDPEMIVLGGGLSNIDAIYPQLTKRLPAYVFGGECTTPIRKAQHGDSSGVLGAAWLGAEGI
jgi:fructokinase